jgi:hypothetical protein
MDDSPSKDIWLRYGGAEREPDTQQLYDLMVDPMERNNLVAAPEHEATLTGLRQRLDDWMKATDDPLLNGPVAAPAGVLINDPSGRSPRDQPQTAE